MADQTSGGILYATTVDETGSVKFSRQQAESVDARVREAASAGAAAAEEAASGVLADAKTYTDAAIAAAKIGGGDMTVATIQAMIQDELDAGDYTGPAGRSITSFGSQDPSTGVIPVHFSDGSTVQLTLPVSDGSVDEAALLAAYETAMG